MNPLVQPNSTVMIFAPHPDDAEFFAGGTLARMIQEGATVIPVIATDGRCGSFEYDSQTLAALRAKEAQAAAQALGAQAPILLGHPDFKLDTLPPGLLREQFVRLLREHRPEVVIAEDPFYLAEVHPDHRAVAWAASDALNFAMLPLLHPEHLEQGLQPHFVTEKYYYGDPHHSDRVVDISGTIEIKLAALGAHRSQMVFLVEDILRQARLAGLNLEAMLGTAQDNPMAAMAWALRLEAQQAGAKIGVEYGEAFRYTRFHPMVENLIQMQAS